jgi:hypothetical protein
MAAITTTDAKSGVYREKAQASSGTRNAYLAVPQWARYATITITPTTIGTSITPSFLIADPNALDDSFVINFAEHAAFTAITGTNNTYVFNIGPGITGIADDVTNAAAADSVASLNGVLPEILGVRVVASGSCIYHLSVRFRV